MAELLHDEVYRGVLFHINKTAFGEVVGVFADDSHRKLIGGDYVSRYFTDEELEGPMQPHYMRQAIDRMYAQTPVYTGDIRYR